MSTWQQVKQTLAVSDRLNEALRALHERHVALVDCQGVEGLTALGEGIEALLAANEPGVERPGPFDTGHRVCWACPVSRDMGQ